MVVASARDECHHGAQLAPVMPPAARLRVSALSALAAASLACTSTPRAQVAAARPPAVPTVDPVADDEPSGARAIAGPTTATAAVTSIDSDGDGVLDVDDKCPSEAATTYDGGRDGCPRPVCGLRQEHIIFHRTIRFARGSAAILGAEAAYVRELADTLQKLPIVTLVEVAGFADDERDAVASVALSTARARAVLDRLVSRGVPRSRLRARGYGPYCRLDPGVTPQARQTNRRVELRVAAVAPGAYTVAPTVLGCPEATAAGLAPEPVPLP